MIEPYYQEDGIEIYNADCLEILKQLPDESVDAIITDPPYNLIQNNSGFERGGNNPNSPYTRTAKGGFMGKEWDGTGIAFKIDLWKECLRVIKPGAHLLAFGGTRTYHRMTCAIEDAGFEIRDMLEWIYASGFPKSLNVGKAYDKKMGNEREKIKKPVSYPDSDDWGIPNPTTAKNPTSYKTETDKVNAGAGYRWQSKGNSEWEGFGTSLKPAHEPIVLARKPLEEKTVVENVLKYGTGALDIDGCRISCGTEHFRGEVKRLTKDSGEWETKLGFVKPFVATDSPLGRFPANLLVTDDALNDGTITKTILQDEGSKSRYFDIDVWAEKWGLLQYPKASKSEKDSGETNNNHLTVKPVHLIAYLVRLVSKEGDVVLDPFMGSGTTLMACKMLGRKGIGVEKEKDYCEIAVKRIDSIPNKLF